MSLEIRHLMDRPDAIPVLADWFVREWEPYYGPEGPGDAGADLRAADDREGLPICLVASLDGQVAGTVALRAEQLPSHRHLSPWMAGLLVAPRARGHDVAGALVEAIVAEARRLGCASIYVGTDELSGAMARRGWKKIDQAPTLRGPTDIFRLDL